MVILSMKNHQGNKQEILGVNFLKWIINKLSPENNPKNAGRQSAACVSSTGGPTPYAKRNSKQYFKLGI